MPRNRLRVVDLFSGAGGLSLGLTMAGLEPVFAADTDTEALRTYRENLGDHAHELDLSYDAELPAAEVFVGGPPCQGFSSAGLREQGDTRNSLVHRFAEIVVAHEPLAFVFENVEGFLTAESGARIMDLLAPLVAAGYQIHLQKLNAANYGVPQLRKRVIAIGARGWDPGFPAPSCFAFGAPGARAIAHGKPRCPTVQDALRSLPSAAMEPPGDPIGHFYTPLSTEDLTRAKLLAPGQTMRDLPDELQHNSYDRRANRRVQDGTPSEKRGGAPAGLRRLRPDEPSKAITGAARNEFLHPFEDRQITLRECARLQTFPDDFVFTGSLSSQMQQIGNAVPPVLARAIGEHLLASWPEETTPDVGEGKLLSFVPTHSTGMSPALQRVTDRVQGSFGLGVQVEELSLWD